jgi:putative ABC transport system ATP-binding protein
MGKGDFVSIMGASGSGKSTLINIIGLLDNTFDGEYRFMGIDVKRLKENDIVRLRAKDIGYIFQAYHLIAGCSVRDNILMQTHYAHKKVSEKEYRELADKLGIVDILDKKAGVLSGGEKQRVSIARALINDPTLVIADEPTGNLDEENTKYVSDIFESMHKNGTSILIVTHDHNLAAKAEKRYLLSEGRLTEVSDE